MLVNWIEFTLITYETPKRRHERLVQVAGEPLASDDSSRQPFEGVVRNRSSKR
jgi:hypothetical protein